MNKELGKKSAAMAALDFIEQDMIVGVGTGSTVNYFIEALSSIKGKIEGVIPSSVATANRLKNLSIPLLDLNAAPHVDVYIDGTDEINAAKQMIKGGGGALTREKIIATVADKFICIADESKLVDTLGAFPVAVEVLPLARSYVARQLVLLDCHPVYREDFITDNGNVILDVYNLSLLHAEQMEEAIKKIVGVVESGIFAKRKANILLLGNDKNARTL